MFVIIFHPVPGSKFYRWVSAATILQKTSSSTFNIRISALPGRKKRAPAIRQKLFAFWGLGKFNKQYPEETQTDIYADQQPFLSAIMPPASP
jgi:hypothetical protein